MARTRAVPRRVNMGNQIPSFGRAGGTGVKRMEGNRRDKKWKIKRFTGQPCNVGVKHRGNTVRRMIVQRRAIYPKTVGGVY